jgi:hypothetical protein
MKIINADLLIEKLEKDIKSFEDEASDIIQNCNDYEGADPLFAQMVATRRIIEFINQNAGENLPKGYPSSIKDITNKPICIGDIVTFDSEDNTSFFEVVFDDNCFRKKYPHWDNSEPLPLLSYENSLCKNFRYKIIEGPNE